MPQSSPSAVYHDAKRVYDKLARNPGASPTEVEAAKVELSRTRIDYEREHDRIAADRREREAASNAEWKTEKERERAIAFNEAKHAAFKLCGLPERHQGQEVRADGPFGETLKSITGKISTGFLIALSGPRGTGKTQLAAEVIRHGVRHSPRSGHSGLAYEPQYVRAMDIFLAVRATYRKGARHSERDVLSDYIRPALLVIDEVQERGDTEWENRLLTYVIDHRYGKQLDTLLIANLQPEALAGSCGPSIVDRMRETGGVIECNWPSFRTQVAE